MKTNNKMLSNYRNKKTFKKTHKTKTLYTNIAL